MLNFLNLGDFLRVVRVDQRQAMEVALADMTDNRREQTHVRDIALRFFDAFGKTRDRHADVGGNAVRARTQGAHRPMRVMPRLPKPCAVLRLGRPFELSAAVLGCDVAKSVGLFRARDRSTANNADQGRLYASLIRQKIARFWLSCQSG